MQKRNATRKTKGKLPVAWAEGENFPVSVSVRPLTGPPLLAKPPTLIVPVNGRPAVPALRRGGPRR